MEFLKRVLMGINDVLDQAVDKSPFKEVFTRKELRTLLVGSFLIGIIILAFLVVFYDNSNNRTAQPQSETTSDRETATYIMELFSDATETAQALETPTSEDPTKESTTSSTSVTYEATATVLSRTFAPTPAPESERMYSGAPGTVGSLDPQSYLFLTAGNNAHVKVARPNCSDRPGELYLQITINGMRVYYESDDCKVEFSSSVQPGWNVSVEWWILHESEEDVEPELIRLSISELQWQQFPQ